jgi:vacuolar-type H+-ATPase subunit I/STV1
VKGVMMTNKYQITKDGQVTIVNSKEEYDEFKTKYNDYEFMMTNRINEAEAVKKPLNGSKVSKKASKLDLILDKLGELEQRIDKLESANSTQGMPE